jgi:hypothetical protein
MNHQNNDGKQASTKSHGIGSLSESYLVEKFAKFTQSDKSSKKKSLQQPTPTSDAELSEKKPISNQRPSSAKSSHSISTGRLIDNLKSKKRNASFESKSSNSINKHITTSTPSTTPAPLMTPTPMTTSNITSSTTSNNTTPTNTTINNNSNNTNNNSSNNNKKLPSSSSSTSSSSSFYEQNETNLSKSNSNNNLDSDLNGDDQNRCPKLIWRNDPQLLIKSSYNFTVQVFQVKYSYNKF